MPQSYTNLIAHIVFSTRDRLPMISATLQPRLYEYLGGFVRGEKGKLYEVGGMPDHVHLLVRLHPDTSVSTYLRDMKGHSSGWIHRTFPDLSDFWWQGGYAAFSVSQSQVESVAKYIRNQAEHHKKRDSRAEFRVLLRAHGITFDEKYLE